MQALAPTALWTGLAAVLVAFIKARSGRKVIITQEDNTIVQAEGYSVGDLQQILKLAKSAAAIDPGQNRGPDSGLK